MEGVVIGRFWLFVFRVRREESNRRAREIITNNNGQQLDDHNRAVTLYHTVLVL